MNGDFTSLIRGRTLLCLKGSEVVGQVCWNCSTFFSTVLGFKRNKTKCSLIGINSYERKFARLTESWGCEVGSERMKYLGLPLGGNLRSKTFRDIFASLVASIFLINLYYLTFFL